MSETPVRRHPYDDIAQLNKWKKTISICRRKAFEKALLARLSNEMA
ncbi:hypothetical protein [Paraburkholderia sp. C35]|nr:hypothetical protein [Paraburkholderia sp. C35]